MVKCLLISFILVLFPFGLPASSADPAFQRYSAANQFFASARYREALSLYENLILSPPHNVPVSDIHTRIGDSYFRLGFFQDALDAYRAGIKGQKENARPETQYWIGFCCFLLGKNSEAVTEFLKIPASYPGSGIWVGTAYYWAGRALERMGRAEEAAEYYRKAGGSGKSSQGKFALEKAAAVKGTAARPRKQQ